MRRRSLVNLNLGIAALGAFIALGVTSTTPASAQSFNHLPSSNNQRSIPKAKGIHLQNIQYLQLERTRDLALEQAMRQTEEYKTHIAYSRSGELKYDYHKLDLNGDGYSEALVYLHSSWRNGSGGGHIWIFQGLKNGYKLVGDVLHTGAPAIIVMPQKTNGWNNLLRVPGNFRSEPVYYTSLRFDGTSYNWPGNKAPIQI
jgi:hypothetical protein